MLPSVPDLEDRPARAVDQELLLVAPRRSVGGHLKDLWAYRELWRQLVRKELKVRYRNSTLGFLWSMLNPAFLLLVYWLVFSFFLHSTIPNFPIWILSGLLVWNLFSSSLGGGASSIVGNSYLVGKVRFPREVLPLATVGAALVHFLLQSGVVIAALVVFRYDIDWAYLPIIVPALLALLLLCAALAILLGTVNVYARDTQHLLELALLAWFWLTPILYPFQLVADKLQEHGLRSGLVLINPMVSIELAFQRGIYGRTSSTTRGPDATGKIVTTVNHYLPDASQWWYLRNVGVVFAVSLAMLIWSIRIFDAAEGSFAEIM